MNTDYSRAAVEMIENIRPKLSTPFRSLPDEELLISGVFLIARKPASENAESIPGNDGGKGKSRL
jgi:hypothetical protein